MSSVTVVISFRNNASTIEDCVRSVLAQTWEDWRLILLDDGSTDGGIELVRRVSDPRVRVIRRNENLGTPVRLNELTDLVTSPYLARMDGDDLMAPRRLELSLAALDDDPTLSFVHGDAISIDSNNTPIGSRPAIRDPSVKQHLVYAPIVHATVTARTSWFAENRYDATYRRCQDQELWVRTLGARHTRNLEAPLLYLREAGTVGASKYATSMAGTRRVLRQHGPGTIGRLATERLVALSFAKQTTYVVCDRLGMIDRVVRSRSRQLPPDEARHHEDVIAAIRATALPGVDDGPTPR